MNEPVRTAVIGLASGVIGAWLVLWMSGPDTPLALQPAIVSGDQSELLARIAALEEQVADRSPASATGVQRNPDIERSDTPSTASPRAATPEATRTQEDRMADFVNKKQERIGEQLRSAGWSDTEIDSLDDLRNEAGLEMEKRMFEMMRKSYGDNPAILGGLSRSSTFRDSLGEERYDQYLAATGRSTALKVTAPLKGSAGETAGLQQGDLIRRFGSDRIYDESDLMMAILKGEPGDAITLEVERDGAVFHVTVPRGPLGITQTARMLTLQ